LNHTYLDSNDGLPYPFYEGWKKNKTITCTDESLSLYDEVSQKFIDTGNIPQPGQTTSNDFVESDIPQENNFENAARDFPSEDFFQNSGRDGPPQDDFFQNSGRDAPSQKDFLQNSARDAPLEEDSFQDEASEYFQDLNRNNPASNQNHKYNDPEYDVPTNSERKRRVDDTEPTSEFEVVSADDNLANVDDNENSRQIKSVEDSSNLPTTPEGSASSTLTSDTGDNSQANQRLLREYQKISEMNMNQTDGAVPARLNVTPTKATDERTKKPPSVTSNTTIRTNSFLKRKKRQISLPSVCKDRRECISGQFQVIRKDLAIIEYNVDYDDCVLSGKVASLSSSLECPPKPVLCEKFVKALEGKPERRLKFRARILDALFCDFCSIPDDSELFRNELPPEVPVIETSRAGMVKNGEFKRRPVSVDNLMGIGYKTQPIYAIFPNGTRMPLTTLPPLPPTTPYVTRTTETTTTTTTTTPIPVLETDEEDPDGHIPEGRLKNFDRLIIYKNQVSCKAVTWIT